ncbi:hypothetical protein E2C01_101445 [Portunus trituberculatus]|uniref:Uncharacterized protein n=1 Tax=Portunus trituberculatus TaxID=210409 RepID=A0A5B7KG45_PORTR|nr:hypothetical protein [Portunus trituberculatus]
MDRKGKFAILFPSRLGEGTPCPQSVAAACLPQRVLTLAAVVRRGGECAVFTLISGALCWHGGLCGGDQRGEEGRTQQREKEQQDEEKQNLCV